MIVVRVELWSAVSGQKTELARMHICNDGTSGGRLRSYDGVTFRGRSSEQLDHQTPSKRGRLENFPAVQLHVWNLVARMLGKMGYR